MPLYYTLLIASKIPSTILSILLKLLSGHHPSTLFPLYFQLKTVCYHIVKMSLSVNPSQQVLMGYSWAILPNKCQYEQRDIFKFYQHAHESLSFPLMTFRESRMLIFSHLTHQPSPCKGSNAGLGQIHRH